MFCLNSLTFTSCGKIKILKKICHFTVCLYVAYSSCYTESEQGTDLLKLNILGFGNILLLFLCTEIVSYIFRNNGHLYNNNNTILKGCPMTRRLHNLCILKAWLFQRLWRRNRRGSTWFYMIGTNGHSLFFLLKAV